MMTLKIGKQGFTLIEVLLSVIIFATSTVFVLQALVKIYEVQSMLHELSEAYFFVGTKMEETQSVIYTQTTPKLTGSGDFRSEGRSVGRWTLASSLGVVAADLQTISLNLSWGAGKDISNVTVSTLAPMIPEEVKV